jgi:hypothetical protein
MTGQVTSDASTILAYQQSIDSTINAQAQQPNLMAVEVAGTPTHPVDAVFSV